MSGESFSDTGRETVRVSKTTCHPERPSPRCLRTRETKGVQSSGACYAGKGHTSTSSRSKTSGNSLSVTGMDVALPLRSGGQLTDNNIHRFGHRQLTSIPHPPSFIPSTRVSTSPAGQSNRGTTVSTCPTNRTSPSIPSPAQWYPRVRIPGDSCTAVSSNLFRRRRWKMPRPAL